MKRVLFIILAVVAVFVIIGVSMAGMASQRSATTDFYNVGPSFGMGGGGGAPEVSVAPAMELPAAEPSYDSATDLAKSEEAYNSVTGQTQERMVIENADLAIVVTDPKTRMAEISKLANDMGGYVVSSNLYETYTNMGKEVPEASVTIRVPSEKLDEVLASIKEGAVDVQYENRSGQDVTNVYVDLQSQLKAKQAAEQQLLKILDKAETAEDVLAIYLQLESIQTQIEQLKGQIKYYEESAALSSVSVRLIAEESTQPIEIGPWTPQGAAKDAVEDLIRFMQNFAEFLIYFVISVLPSLILIAIPLYLVYLAGRAIFRRFRKKNVYVDETDELKK
jgi:hypothetical protein